MRTPCSLLLALAASLSAAQPIPPPPTDGGNAMMERGKYLVERVAVCANCHTPRDWRGRFIAARSLMGAKLEFAPVRSIPWAPNAPQIAGLPSFATDEQAVKYFEAGRNAAGKESLPPMPQMRLTHEDALAVVAYLRSIKPDSIK